MAPHIFKSTFPDCSIGPVIALAARIVSTAKYGLVALGLTTASIGFSADLLPPSAPLGLTASAATCGQVHLSWTASVDETGGSGLYSYAINRSDGVNPTIGAAHSWYDDTNFVKASTTITYYVVAKDNAGNTSLPSNSVSVTTPGCPVSAGEQIISAASVGTLDAKEPLGKAIATWGSLSAYLYLKWNNTATLDTWVYLSDASTGQSSSFLLHPYPGYYMVETDYVFTSATELWTVGRDSSVAQQVRVSKYQLNSSAIPTSATLSSTQLFGDSHSTPRSMIRLQSGALLVAWNEADAGYFLPDLVTGFAYRSPTGVWKSQFPLTVTDLFGGNATMTQMTMAQHPADGSIWVFAKRDSFQEIIALHFTEASGTLSLDWTNAGYIAQPTCSYPTEPCYNDGINGPEGEFPFLSAIPDPTRNAILLAYQRNDYQFVFSNPAFTNDSVKEATVAIAQIASNASKTFIAFPSYIERIQQFGFSVLPNGDLSLVYHPINHQTLTWNEVYTRTYSNGSWSAPVFVGFNYNYYNSIGPYRNPGLVAYRTDQPQVAFRTPDQKIHTFNLSNLGAAPADTTNPTTAITSPANGATVSGTVTLSASASDNTGIARVEIWLDGSLVATGASSPLNFSWDSKVTTNRSHTLQAKAYDAAGNLGLSTPLAISVDNTTSTSPLLAVSITNPSNGSTVPRNQNVTINATTSTLVSQVQFYVDDTLLGTATTAPYNFPWKVPARKGTHSIKAQAYDTAGKTAAQSITVTAQ